METQAGEIGYGAATSAKLGAADGASRVFDQRNTAAAAQFGDCVQAGGIAECVHKDDSLGSRGQQGHKCLRQHVIGFPGNVCKDGRRPQVLHHIGRGGKREVRDYDLIPRADT